MLGRRLVRLTGCAYAPRVDRARIELLNQHGQASDDVLVRVRVGLRVRVRVRVRVGVRVGLGLRLGLGFIRLGLLRARARVGVIGPGAPPPR